MIQEVQTRKGLPAITSDQWHVVLSRLIHPGTEHPFERGVESEHPDRASCRRAAEDLRLRIDESIAGVADADRGEVFVRKPNFKSLKMARALRGGGA